MVAQRLFPKVGALLTSLALLAALAACGPDTPVDPFSEQPPTDGIPPGIDERGRQDLLDERPVDWDRAEVVSDYTIRVHYWAGTERCYGVRAVVQETQTTVAIGLLEGKLPEAPAACTMEAHDSSVLVDTQRPVGDRQIVQLVDTTLYEHPGFRSFLVLTSMG